MGPSECYTNLGSRELGADGCLSSTATIDVSATEGTTTTLLWTDLTGGSPQASPDPAQIVQLHWSFEMRDAEGNSSYPQPVYFIEVYDRDSSLLDSIPVSTPEAYDAEGNRIYPYSVDVSIDNIGLLL
jgi:hypothetical protein